VIWHTTTTSSTFSNAVSVANSSSLPVHLRESKLICIIKFCTCSNLCSSIVGQVIHTPRHSASYINPVHRKALIRCETHRCVLFQTPWHAHNKHFPLTLSTAQWFDKDLRRSRSTHRGGRGSCGRASIDNETSIEEIVYAASGSGGSYSRSSGRSSRRTTLHAQFTPSILMSSCPLRAKCRVGTHRRAWDYATSISVFTISTCLTSVSCRISPGRNYWRSDHLLCLSIDLDA
jgi:hypothetical protein